MSAQYSKYLKFGSAIAVIVLALAYLAYTGVRDPNNLSYYKTISELQTEASQGNGIYEKRLRVAGNVAAGSIKRQGTRVEFALIEQDKTLPVVYEGVEAPPDTFKDGAQAMAEGHLGRDGVFRASNLQAKCASKYAAAPQKT
ncbi:MAG TPA: cytochrome c maturation protein CcmE [Terriglobales bacterium]|jgi:cytochrome c-type biogenesis protein CcmE|nr:cytochrome c maturation protein CcmE [Terriglobales bacterium]